jgi:hypothetical protein
MIRTQCKSPFTDETHISEYNLFVQRCILVHSSDNTSQHLVASNKCESTSDDDGFGFGLFD